MSKISHNNAKSLIQATMGGSITVPEKENLAQHLNTCAACREYASQMDTLEGSLRRSFHTRWDSIRGPSKWVVEDIYKKTRATFMYKKIFSFASTAIVIGVLAAITFFIISISPKQSEPIPGGQPMQTQIPTPTPTIIPAVTTSGPGQGNCALRTQTITYTVQSGDTIIGIADYYCLKPETILWANYNLLRINYNSLVVGLVIDIPAKDGEYVWAASQLGLGACQNIVSNFDGTGTFIWPTKLHFISGEDYAPGMYQFGIDLAGSTGDQVYASDRGVVIFAGSGDWGYGNMVVIDHGNGKQTLYAYLSSIDVACGDHVEQGSSIGKIGNTGDATGPSLHFEMIVNNEHVNPHEYLPTP